MRRSGWDPTKPRADFVEFQDGRLVTVDHRRIVAARIAGLDEVPATIHPAQEMIPQVRTPTGHWAGDFRLRVGFTDPRTGITYQVGQTPRNWGEAVTFRSANQKVMGFPDFPLEGSFNEPQIRPLNNLGQQ